MSECQACGNQDEHHISGGPACIATCAAQRRQLADLKRQYLEADGQRGECQIELEAAKQEQAKLQGVIVNLTLSVDNANIERNFIRDERDQLAERVKILEKGIRSTRCWNDVEVIKALLEQALDAKEPFPNTSKHTSDCWSQVGSCDCEAAKEPKNAQG